MSGESGAYHFATHVLPKLRENEQRARREAPRKLREASLRVSNAKLAVERAVEEYGHACAELTILQRKWGGVL